MKLYEPVSMAWLLITVLILAFSGELGSVFMSKYERDCWKSNAILLEEGRQGPLRGCKG